jgi:hypothetical protein
MLEGFVPHRRGKFVTNCFINYMHACTHDLYPYFEIIHAAARGETSEPADKILSWLHVFLVSNISIRSYIIRSSV